MGILRPSRKEAEHCCSPSTTQKLEQVMKTRIVIALLACSLLVSGCASVTITQQGQPDHTYWPHYEERKDFFLWGLIGEHTVNTRAICKDKTVVQMQTKFSAMDVLYAGLTLGLYLPRTAKVWCERPEVEE